MPRKSKKRGGGNQSIGGFKKNTGISAARKAKREDGESTSATHRSSKKQKAKAAEAPKATAAAAAAYKPSAYRLEHKKIAITEKQQPLLNDRPPVKWVEGGKQRNKKGEEKTTHVLTVDNACDMHPILNAPSKKKSTSSRPTISIAAMKNKFKKDAVEVWSPRSNKEELLPFGMKKKDVVKRYGSEFWDLYKAHHTKDKVVNVCCIYVTHVLDSRERNQWYSQVQVVRRAGLLDTIVPIRFHFDLTVDKLRLLEDPAEQRRAGFLWDCMHMYMDPKGSGSRSIIFNVNVGEALSLNEVRECAMVAGDEPDNFIPTAMVVVRYKIELWWLMFNRRAEAALADLDEDEKQDKKRCSSSSSFFCSFSWPFLASVRSIFLCFRSSKRLERFSRDDELCLFLPL